MDSVRSSGRSYRWPTDVLRALSIAKSDIGVAAITTARIDGVAREIYLPLRIGQDRSAGGYELLLIPGVELKEVYLTVAGDSGAAAGSAKPLAQGYYPAGRAIVVPVPAPRAHGIYRLTIAAALRSGGASTVDLWFYHPGTR
jgi:hypothetical protein